MSYTFEPVDCCPVCGGEGRHDLSIQDHELDVVLSVYSCKRCDTSYHNPRMTKESMAEYYSSGTYRAYKNRQYDIERKKRLTKEKTNYLGGFFGLGSKRYIDVGCGQGYLIQAMQDKFPEAEMVGYDVYQDPIATIKVITDKKDITRKFDLITCIHVLEHCHDPMKEIDWMVSLLSEQGVLLIEIPLIMIITTPHPIMFSRKSISLLVKQTGMNGVFVDRKDIGVGLICIKRKPWTIKI